MAPFTTATLAAPEMASANREADWVFESAAELFGLLATPVRLKIISEVCNGERNVSELLLAIGTTQPNMSQHLSTLHKAGVLGRRREGTQIFYSLQSARVAALCRIVCTQIALDLDQPAAAAQRGPSGESPQL